MKKSTQNLLIKICIYLIPVLLIVSLVGMTYIVMQMSEMGDNRPINNHLASPLR